MLIIKITLKIFSKVQRKCKISISKNISKTVKALNVNVSKFDLHIHFWQLTLASFALLRKFTKEKTGVELSRTEILWRNENQGI